MSETASTPESGEIAEAVADLQLWLDGKRSMTNYIVGSLGGREGDSETERRLIWEADNAQIVARAALVNAAVAMSTPPAESDRTCRYGTHAPRDCPARVFALNGAMPPACPVVSNPPEGTVGR